MSTNQEQKKPSLNFTEPPDFVYANSFRTYGSGMDVTVEFGRSRPMTSLEQVEVVGAVGVIMGLEAAKQLVAQLQDAIQKSQEKARIGLQLMTTTPSPQ